MEEKVTVYEILHIAPGERKLFYVPSLEKMKSASNLAWMMPKLHPRPDVSNYKCERVDRKDGVYTLAITAIPKTDSYDKA